MSKEQTQRHELTPKLRFPEFRDARGWRKKPMGDLYGFMGTNSFSREKLNYDHGLVKNIHYGDIHTKFSPLFDLQNETVPFVNHSESPEKTDPNSYCTEGDMIFADASEDLKDIGKSIEIVRLHNEPLLSGLHTILARQKDNSLAVGFGGYLFQTARIRDQIRREAQGTKVLGVSSHKLSRVKLSYPVDKVEQRRIIECLSSIDELIAVEVGRRRALEAQSKGLLHMLFPAQGETVPRLRFPEFRDAGEWCSDSLGNIFETSSGGTPSRSTKEYWNGEIPWVTTSLVDFKVITEAEEFISERGLEESSAKVFPKGTILVAMYGQGKTRGKAAMLGIEAATNQACAAILPLNGIDPSFVFLNLANRYDEMRELSNSGGQENLSQTLIKELPFSFPKDTAEQRRIIDCLTPLTELISAQERKITTQTALKKGLMQQLFPNIDEAGG